MDKSAIRVSIRHMMMAIVFVCLAMSIVRQLFFASTTYSAGYDEGRFRQVHAGMTSEDVEALLGTPLTKVPWPHEGTVNWSYTTKSPGYSNYYKRNIHMKNGNVNYTINTYWID